jgi:hypothetical protein
VVLVASGAVYSIVVAAARRRKQGESLSAIDFARASFARQLNTGVPLAELLLQLVEALRDTFRLDAAELWLCENGTLNLAASEPRQERAPVRITKAEESIAANARVSSAAWARKGSLRAAATALRESSRRDSAPGNSRRADRKSASRQLRRGGGSRNRSR